MNHVVANESRDVRLLIRIDDEVVDTKSLGVNFSHRPIVDEESSVVKENDVSRLRQESVTRRTEGDVHVLHVEVGTRHGTVRIDGEVVGVVLPRDRVQLELVDVRFVEGRAVRGRAPHFLDVEHFVGKTTFGQADCDSVLGAICSRIFLRFRMFVLAVEGERSAYLTFIVDG